jgi:osmotically inducible protein OsmC
MKSLYTGHATSVAGRGGHVETDDKKLSYDLTPFSNPGKGTNPEQLFACAYSACFGGAVEAVAKSKQIKPGEVKVQADVSLNQDDKNGFFISVVLNVSIAGVEASVARELVEAAHQVCPYSKATRGNVEVVLKVGGEKLAAAA